MILLSVGTQFPFDRLVRAVDEWAANESRKDVVAQVGPSDYVPRMLEAHRFIAPDAFAALQREADVLIAHAGMGSILTALELGKPIIIMPREHARGEHRNDHQLATLPRFRDFPGVFAARDETELRTLLARVDEMSGNGPIGREAQGQLIDKLRTFIG